MKRLLLSTLVTAYLTLIGVKAAHLHKSSLESRSTPCAVCVLADQSVSQVPNAAPAAVHVPLSSSPLPPLVLEASVSAAVPTSARAPPASA